MLKFSLLKICWLIYLITTFSCDILTKTENKPPLCNITTPQSYTQIRQGNNLVIAADISDEDGDISDVRFYIDDTEVHVLYNLPYYYSWNTTGAELDTHTIKIVARDNDGDESTDQKEVIIIPNLLASSHVTDIDGNVYRTITIGNQVWMAENLKVTRYRNGHEIPHVTDNEDWIYREYPNEGAYCAYANNQAYTSIYGLLYNWHAVDDPRGLAPAGWHIPSNEDWEILIQNLGGMKISGGLMKEAGTDYWKAPNTGATNESGFNARPGGRRLSNGNFSSITWRGFFWSSTQDIDGNWNYQLRNNESVIYGGPYWNQDGYSVRCIKD